jgi:hypothetical protein
LKYKPDDVLPCARCGQPGTSVWTVCADAGRVRVLCSLCDIEANRVLMSLLKVRGQKRLLANYALKQDQRPVTLLRLKANGFYL